MPNYACYQCGDPTYDDTYREALLSDLGIEEARFPDSLEAEDIRLEIFRCTPFLHQGARDASKP